MKKNLFQVMIILIKYQMIYFKIKIHLLLIIKFLEFVEEFGYKREYIIKSLVNDELNY